jgi:3-dehydroquinate synthase class II
MDKFNITSAQYVADLGENISIKATIDGNEVFVPMDTNNRHYAAIIEWASQDGNTIADAD